MGAATRLSARRDPLAVAIGLLAMNLVDIAIIATTSCEAFPPISPLLAAPAGSRYRQQKRGGPVTSSILYSTTEKAGDTTSEKEEEEGKEEDDETETLSAMPWSDLQSWALRDNLPKYVITIPIPGTDSRNGDKPRYGTYALWRTMLKETTELAGYEVEYVRKAYESDVLKREDWAGYAIGAKGEESSKVAPGVLPLLESFEFHPDGGVSGLAYGIPGIAGGTNIRPTAVSNIQKTVILGYVETKDGSAAYELGSPVGESYSWGSGGVMSEDARRTMLENVARTAASVVQSGTASTASAGKLAADAASRAAGGETNSNLVNLAGTAAIMLAGATAIGMMSHHLTVNVFWV